MSIVIFDLKLDIMIEIQNTQECFVQLWRKLERTRRLLRENHKRFSERNILKMWLGYNATDDFIWEVCRLASDEDNDLICGNDELQEPALYPRRHRELLRALVAVVLHIGMRKVSLRDLDKAYSIAFPQSTPINVNKKKRDPLPTSPRGGGRELLND